MERILRKPFTPRKGAKSRSRIQLPIENTPVNMRTPPIVPRREASLGQDAASRQPETPRSGWPEPGRTLATGWPRSRGEIRERAPSSATCPGDAAVGDRGSKAARILRSPRSVGGGALRTLGSSISSETTDTNSVERSRQVGDTNRGQGKNQSSRWAWPSWWQLGGF